MTIKLGNTEINAVSVTGPYGDDLTVVPDEPVEPWVRPSHWLDMPVINSGEQKCAFLIQIPSGESALSHFGLYATGPTVAHNIRGTSFTVDWGDGTTHNAYYHGSRFASNTPEERLVHDYSFEDLDPSTQFEDEGRFFRQAMVIFNAPLSGILGFEWRIPKSYGSSSVPCYYNVLEFDINLPSGISIGGNRYGYNTFHPRLQKARLNMPNVTNLHYYFNSNIKLRSVELVDTTLVTSADGLFKGCKSLDYVPDLNLPNLTVYTAFFSTSNIREYNNNINISSNASSFSSMFTSCPRLKTVHIDIPSSTTNTQGMFSHCRSLISVSGDFNTPNLTTARDMFYGSYSLINAPDVNLSSCTNAREMFRDCKKLNGHVKINAPNLNDAERMYYNCGSIDRVTIEDLSSPSASNFNSLFHNCQSLRVVDVVNPNIPCSYSPSMFNGCADLQSVGSINFSGCSNLTSLFNSCTKLKKLGTLHTPTVTTFNNMFAYCYELTKSTVSDITAQGTGNVSCDSMFLSCFNLKEAPNLDYSRVSNFDQMFYNCSKMSGSIETLDFSNIARSTTTNSMASYRMFYNTRVSSINNMVLPVSGYFLDTFSNSNISTINNIVSNVGYNYSTMFNYSYYLEKAVISGVNIDIGYHSCELPSGACCDIIENLASGVVGKTLTMTSVPGAQILHPDTISIATSKGWTVTT